MNIDDVNRIIDAIISNPRPDYTREYAQELLRSCGILDENNEIVPAYQDIVKKEVKPRCHKCFYEMGCSRTYDKYGECKRYKRDSPDGGYYG